MPVRGFKRGASLVNILTLTLKALASAGAFYFFDHRLIAPKCNPIPGTKCELNIPKGIHL